MRKRIHATRILALLLALFVAVPAISANADANISLNTAASGSVISHYDYFSDVYPNLQDSAHVFKTVTYEDIATIFGSQGTYAILFGGASVPSTQAEIGFINQAAKAYGINTIYNFDTKLDGVSLDLADSSNPFANVYTDLVNKYLTEKDASGTVVAVSPAADVKNQTFLFVYNKDHKNGANSQPILKYLKSSNSWDDFLTGGAVDASKTGAFKTQVLDLFGAAPAADFKTINNNDLFEAAFNKNVKFNAPAVGRDIFDGTDGNLVFEHVTYHELTRLLDSRGNYAILFGGSWCPNTQAAIKFINEYAKKYNIDKIYMWDPRLDAGVDVTQTDSPKFDSHNIDRLMVRGTGHPYANLYVDLVNKYLTNIQTQYVKGTTDVRYKNASGQDVIANKLQVPYLYIYNKDNKDTAGNSAPILGHVELMYSWTNIQPDYVPVGVLPNTIYKAALDKLFSRLESVPSGLTAVAPTASANNDGQITGANAALEYKAAGASDYIPVTGTAITGLSPGTYNVRYAAKPGFHGPISQRINSVTTLIKPVEVLYSPGQSVNVTVLGFQAPPAGLAGVTPTTTDNKDGQITGTSQGQEYKLQGADTYLPVTDTTISGLAPGAYLVRNAAREGFNASGPTTVIISAYGEQPVPTGLQGVAPTSASNEDGQIKGTSTALEYKLVGDVEYIPVEGTLITGLKAGTYQVRTAANDGLAASPAIEVVVPAFIAEQAAPTGLTGIAPTSSANNNGQITGTTAAQEYKLSTASTYTAATATAITGLAAGTYDVRFAAKEGYYASPSVQVVVPAYVSYPSGGNTGGTGGAVTAPVDNSKDVTTKTEGTKTTSVITVPVKTDPATSTATAIVSQESVAALADSLKKAAASGNAAVVEFKVAADATTKTAQISIPLSAFSDVATSASAEIKVNYAHIGAINFDAKAVASIGAAGKGDVTIAINKLELNEEGKQALGNRPVYDLSVAVGDNKVSSFGGGKVNVSVPYTLQAAEDSNAIVVYYLTEDGYLEPVSGKYDQATGTVNFVATHFSQYIVAYNKVAFHDVSDTAWYGKAVTFLAARDIASGTDDTHYSPLTNVTRGQFIVLLLKAYGIVPNESEVNNFIDAGNAYYTNYLGAAKRLGITTGLGDNRFAPDQAITRQDLFTLLYRALNVLGKLPSTNSGAAVVGFADAGKIAGYAQEAFQALVKSGVVTGSDGKLNPAGLSTRAEVAQVLYNLLSNE